MKLIVIKDEVRPSEYSGNNEPNYNTFIIGVASNMKIARQIRDEYFKKYKDYKLKIYRKANLNSWREYREYYEHTEWTENVITYKTIKLDDKSLNYWKKQ